MKTIAALAVIASVVTLAALDTTGAEARGKFRIRDHHQSDNWKISCNTARHMVRERGYNPVRIKSCITTPYAFYAVRNGHTYIVRVHQRTGFVTRE